MKLRTYLQLGRVSNLPTVWTNVLAGGVLAGGTLTGRALTGPLAAGTAFYVGGMFLNDGFDREIDRRERADRPIPSGRVGVGEVFAIGFGLLLAGWLILLAQLRRGYGSPTALVAGAALAGAIVLYNAWHKGNPISPVLMGACRALLYAMAGLALAAHPSPALWAGAAVLLAYLVGLTYVAKQETLTELPNTWPLLFLAVPFAYTAGTVTRNASAAILYAIFLAWVLYALRMLVRRVSIGRAVVTLIAGMSLLDALLIAGAGAQATAWVAAAGLLLTMALQRWVSGT